MRGGAYIDTYPRWSYYFNTNWVNGLLIICRRPHNQSKYGTLLLTPICPHTLQSRSIVISKDDTVKVQVIAEHPEIMVTVDGQQGYKLLPGDEVIIKKSKYYTELVRIKNRSFYDILRKKLTESEFQ